MRRAVHFGAGSIGRGFIGERLHASGYEVVFADVNEDLINMINEEQGYELQLINHDLQSLYIDLSVRYQRWEIKRSCCGSLRIVI